MIRVFEKSKPPNRVACFSHSIKHSTNTQCEHTESYVTSYTYDKNNRLLAENKTSGSTTQTTRYTYDANGNTLTKTSGATSEQYSYDGFNRLVKVVNGVGTTTYAYRSDGLRSSKTVAGVQTTHIWDGQNMSVELDKTGAVLRTYIRGIGLIAEDDAAGTRQYALYNAHGDVVQLTDKNGAVTKEYLYDAFGNERSPDANDANPFRYCGEYFDVETGDIYLRARYYRPAMGRFTQMDSVWSASYTLPNEQSVINPLSLNLYTYCYNNPVYYNDRTGAEPEVVKWWKDVTRRGEADWALLATIGAYKDSNNIYHIFNHYWQSISWVGYNDLYDMIFDAACDMNSTKFRFEVGGKQFAIWAWKGDYINLGAGAELGIYWNYGSEHWWTGTPYAVPMTLQLIDTRNGGYTEIFYWEPKTNQWWITGFDPSHQGMKAKDLEAVYTLDLNGQINMFNSLKNRYEGYDKDGTRWLFDNNKHRATMIFK